MSIGSTLKETFSLSNIFKTAVISVPIWLALGAVDLAIWHYMPGGVELFHALKEPLLNNPVAAGISDVFSQAATALGGGPQVLAEQAGAAFDPASGGLVF